MSSSFKKALSSELDSPKETNKTFKVKFNFSLSSPKYDSSFAVKKAREEKSHIAFELQNHIDLMTFDNFYEAGKVYDVPEEFFNKFAGREVETYNPLFGNFQGKSAKFSKRPKVPYMLKVDETGCVLDPMQRSLDIYAKDE